MSVQPPRFGRAQRGDGEPNPVNSRQRQAKPRRYRSKPVTIEAVMVTAMNAQSVAEWCAGEAHIDELVVLDSLEGKPTDVTEATWVQFETIDGNTVSAPLGTWVAKGAREKDFYPIHPFVFSDRWEPDAPGGRVPSEPVPTRPPGEEP